ncbi:hypothetical protein CFC21_083820, partial [Triticum aestivum]
GFCRPRADANGAAALARAPARGGRGVASRSQPHLPGRRGRAGVAESRRGRRHHPVLLLPRLVGLRPRPLRRLPLRRPLQHAPQLVPPARRRRLPRPAGYSGTLPAAVLASLPFLQTLSLRGNSFHGALPAGVALPPSLRVLVLSGNDFSGEIPASLFTPASSLDELDLSRNAFTGAIPPQVASLGALTRMELQHNRLTGNLPSMGKMRSLVHLDVSDNQLTGPLLDAPGRLPPTLLAVVARDNRLSGPLQAAAFHALPEMQVLDLTNNAVTGAVPGAAFEHPALAQLRLGSNQLGTVEEASGGGVASSQLLEVDLSGNKITGRLPRCLGAIPRLRTVGLDRNRFVGGVPKQYAVRAAAVEVVDGKAPFARLMLQGNYLCGGLPRELRQMKDGGAMVSLADNCLLKCPHKFFFCQGPPQKNRAACPKCEP